RTRCVDRGLSVRDGRARDRGDLVLGRRIDDVEAALIGGRAPFPPDPQIGRNIRGQIIVHRTPLNRTLMNRAIAGSARQYAPSSAAARTAGGTIRASARMVASRPARTILAVPSVSTISPSGTSPLVG